ncbi:MAG: hypothetical protein AAGA78_05430 [Pseudomonadota bacterium]
MTDEREPTELELLIPWYVAGTLDGDDLARVEAAIAQDAQFAEQVAQASEEAEQAQLAAEAFGRPSSEAQARLMAALDAEPARTPGILSRLSNLLTGFGLSGTPARLAFAALMAALVVQAVLLSAPAPSSGFATASGEPEIVAGPQYVVLVTFVPEAQIRDMSALVTTMKGDVISGPKGGYYRVAFASEDAARAAVLQFTAAPEIVGFATLEEQ